MPFQVHQPKTVEEAIGLAVAFGTAGSFLAGGTDLIIQINRKRRTPQHLIALGGISDLAGIDVRDDAIVVGAMTTHKTIERSDAFRGPLAALPEAARVIGGHQVRNVATVGGNIVNASPAADLLPPLLALDATLTLAGSSGTRRVALAGFQSGPGETGRRDDEILLQVTVRRPAALSASAFIKAGRRRAMEISVVCVAAFLELANDGTCRAARIGLGAVGPTALRASDAEASLCGCVPTEQALRDAGRLAAANCAPIDDVRASAEYRRMLVQALVPRALQRCLQRIDGRPQ